MSQVDAILNRIAQKHLGIDILQTCHADSLDQHVLVTEDIRKALEAAFKTGVEVGLSLPEPTEAQIASA